MADPTAGLFVEVLTSAGVRRGAPALFPQSLAEDSGGFVVEDGIAFVWICDGAPGPTVRSESPGDGQKASAVLNSRILVRLAGSGVIVPFLRGLVAGADARTHSLDALVASVVTPILQGRRCLLPQAGMPDSATDGAAEHLILQFSFTALATDLATKRTTIVQSGDTSGFVLADGGAARGWVSWDDTPPTFVRICGARFDDDHILVEAVNVSAEFATFCYEGVSAAILFSDGVYRSGRNADLRNLLLRRIEHAPPAQVIDQIRSMVARSEDDKTLALVRLP